MSGWRDTEGRTASERNKQKAAQGLANFAETARYRPLSLLKGLLAFAFIAVLVLALIGFLR